MPKESCAPTTVYVTARTGAAPIYRHNLTPTFPPSCACVPTRRGTLWSGLDLPAARHNPRHPIHAALDDTNFQQITCPSIDIFGFAGRQVEGFLDVAHFGFVHTKSFGDPHNTAVAPYMPVDTPEGFEVEYRSSVGNYPIGAHDRGREGFEWLRHFRCICP